MSKNPDFMSIDKKCRKKGSTDASPMCKALFHYPASLVPGQGMSALFNALRRMFSLLCSFSVLTAAGISCQVMVSGLFANTIVSLANFLNGLTMASELVLFSERESAS
eukprot:1139952-Pelagomonas_calceolata.AAC.2